MKLNKFFSWTALVFLFVLPFFIGCGEDERYMAFPNLDLPDSVTVTIEVPAGAAFDLAVASDFRGERDDLGNRLIVHNTEQKYSFTEDFSQTFPLVDSAAFPLVDPDERFFSVMLKCTALESESDEDTGSLRLIIKFNRDGNSEEGNYDETFFPEPANVPTEDEWKRDFGNDPQDWPSYFKLGRLINFQTVFSRYYGIRPDLPYTPYDNR